MLIWLDIVGIFVGLCLGIIIAVYVTLGKVNASNDMGDSNGEFEDFADKINILLQERGIRDSEL